MGGVDCFPAGRGGVFFLNVMLAIGRWRGMSLGVHLMPQSMSIWGNSERARLGEDCSDDHFPCKNCAAVDGILLR